MVNSFIIFKSKDNIVDIGTSIEKLHVNYWHEQSCCDFGILFSMKIDEFPADKDICLKYDLIIPFEIEKDTQPELLNKKMIKSTPILETVFNDIISNNEAFGTVGNMVTLNSNNKYLFLSENKISFINSAYAEERSATIKIDLNKDDIDRIKKYRKDSDDDSKIPLYIRFRIQIDKDKSICTNSIDFYTSKRDIFDFRFNDFRSFSGRGEEDYSLENMIKIMDLYIFMIMPVSFDIKFGNEDSNIFKPIRILETDNSWQDYIPINTKNPPLVFYWRFKQKSELNFNVTIEYVSKNISFEKIIAIGVITTAITGIVSIATYFIDWVISFIQWIGSLISKV